MDFVAYFNLAFLVFIVNALPAFMPPTWMILVFFLTTKDLFSVPVVVIGASMALLGRMCLYYFSSKSNRHLPTKMSNNYIELGKILGKNKVLSLPLFLLFAFYPLPSNQLFIMAGLSKLNPRLLAISFLGGRLLSYSFWVGGARAIDKNIEVMFREGFEPKSVVTIAITMLLLIILPGLVDWKKIASRLSDLCL